LLLCCAVLCCAVQVPLQLGAAFVAAAQQDFKSPATQMAMHTLDSLMLTVSAAAVPSNTASIKEQLQQSGMLQQLPAVLVSMAGELRAETAALAAGACNAATGDVHHYTGRNSVLSRFTAVVCFRRLLWAFGDAQHSSAGWLWGSSGLAVAVMQFATAGLQHVSSIVQHVLPAVRQHLPQLTEGLRQNLNDACQEAGALCTQAFLSVLKARLQPSPQQQGQRSEAGGWHQLPLSPPLLPCLAAMVVVVASHLGRSVAAHCAKVQASSASVANGQSSGSSKEPGTAAGSSATGQPQVEQQGTPDRTAGSNSSGEGPSLSGSLTACQAQLLQLLGLAPEVIDWMMQSYHPRVVDIELLHSQLQLALATCIDCCDAAWQLLDSSSTGSGATEEQQQRLQFEQRLWRLLPMVLLPCASSLLLPGAPTPSQIQGDGLIEQLLALSKKAAAVSDQLHLHLQTICIPSAAATAEWIEELLGAVLQLVDRLHQQPPLLAASQPAATTGPAGSSSSSSSTGGSQPAMRSLCAGHMLPLLLNVASNSMKLSCDPSSNDDSNSYSHIDSSNSAAAAAFSSGALAVWPLSAQFWEYVAAFEAMLRAASPILQSGTLNTTFLELSGYIGALCSVLLLPRDEQTDSLLLRHTGLRQMVAQEQQQLYSLISTLLKLRCCVHASHQWGFGDFTASTSCLAAGHAAVGLLKLASGASGTQEAAIAEQQSQLLASGPPAATAAAAQPAVSYLPSLVLFGRCLLWWAQQLGQQSRELVLLGPLQLQQQQPPQGSTLLYEHGAARVCIPGLQEGSAITPIERLESLAATVCEWVGGMLISSPAYAQLAAAGCSPEQLQQQLGALLSTQQGTQQGLTDASLAALVQQLQATGAMLCNIAVPHFCNNPACANLSGPTEVRLVSGRSCICAGCRIARYCGRACQRAAWTQHKPVCKALAAVGATAAATARGS
jgi:hypothetical protein